MTDADSDTTFRDLRRILEPYAPDLVTVHDEPDHYYLDAAHLMGNGKPLYFGSVRTGKAYVSFHLMPVYLWPELLDQASDDLRRRMQGKSCFNFKRPDPDLFQELAELTRSGFDRYREAGYLG